MTKQFFIFSIYGVRLSSHPLEQYYYWPAFLLAVFFLLVTRDTTVSLPFC